MWDFSDSAYKNTSIRDGLTWSEIIPKKKITDNKNGGQGDLLIALSLIKTTINQYEDEMPSRS